MKERKTINMVTRVSPEFLEKLNGYSSAKGYYRSDVVRQAIVEYMEAHPAETGSPFNEPA